MCTKVLLLIDVSLRQKSGKWVEPISFSIYLHKKLSCAFLKVFSKMFDCFGFLSFLLDIHFDQTWYDMEFRISIWSFLLFDFFLCVAVAIYAKYSRVVYFYASLRLVLLLLVQIFANFKLILQNSFQKLYLW